MVGSGLASWILVSNKTEDPILEYIFKARIICSSGNMVFSLGVYLRNKTQERR
jgi:hypothetical protein